MQRLDEWQDLLLKCLAVPHLSFSVFISDIRILNLKNFIAVPTCCSRHFTPECNIPYCDHALKSFVKHHVIFANVAFVTASNESLSFALKVGIFLWC